MNRGLHALQPYPFERLGELRARATPRADLALINLSIGEPQHPTPPAITAALSGALAGTARYPATRGLPELRQVIAAWASRRYGLPPHLLDPERQVLPVNGTREALFAVAQCMVESGATQNVVAMPNPFYQIYEGAALLAGGEPYYLPCPAAGDFRPDWAAVPAALWQRVALVYVCSPGNPSGSLFTSADYATLTTLADRHGFIIVADECYSEIYHDETRPPLGLLEWCAGNGRPSFARCLVINSLSKRSNAPGLRSGFVIGDADLIEAFYRYRTYQGGAMPLHVQHASIAAWSDEAHVVENRARYRAKFDAVVPLLAEVASVQQPPAGFYLWPQFDCDDILLCERLLREAAVLTLPGRFLARDAGAGNPGCRRLRLALVAELADCDAAVRRIRDVLGARR